MKEHRHPEGSRADDLRAAGWMVAVHNDYVLHGEFYTFWLLTHSTSGRFLKGEGRTDADALNQIRLQMAAEAKATEMNGTSHPLEQQALANESLKKLRNAVRALGLECHLTSTRGHRRTS